jgi:transglutaminase-like putative cysteine protease
MYLERLLQITMATLAALGALLLGMGERSLAPPLLIILAAASSIWLTDVTGRIRIGRWTANVLMLVGAFVSLRDQYPPRSEMQTIGLSWFLIYLQIILLFQEKDQWKYWLLVMISLLEVVMATLFSQGIWFGVLIVVYMLVGFSAMTLLILYRQWKLFATGVEQWKGTEEVAAGGFPRLVGFFRQPPPSPSTSEGGRDARAPGRETPERKKPSRWPLAAEQAEFSSVPGGNSHAGVDRDLVGRLSRMGLNTMALTFVLFFAVPRYGQVTFHGPLAKPQPLVGFNDKVTLGELGKIIESRETVMKVAFLKDRSGNDPLPPLNGDLYLQGAYLMLYEHGQWSAGQPNRNQAADSALLQREHWLPEFGIVRQKITIDGADRNELFYVSPYISLEETNTTITVDHALQRLQRSVHHPSQQFKYTLATTAIVGGEQLPSTPAAQCDLSDDTKALPRGDLPQLVKLAKRWIAESGLPETDRRGRAECLARKLALSREFQYSLSGAERDPNIDPIEDFVVNHKQGHCEYFATALTLMLRSQGIRARMVCGYKCDHDDWNSAGGYYQVRQWHAHAWAEAFLRSNQLPEKWKHGKSYWRHRPRPELDKDAYDSEPCWATGGWLRLDPTPAGAAANREDWLTPLRKGLDWLDGVWSRYVVELNYQTQRDAIYQPIADAARNVWRKITNAQSWRSMFDSVSVALYLDHLGREVKWILLGVIGATLLLVLVGVGVVLVRFGRRLWAGSKGSHGRRRGRGRAEVAFYKRFESLMARQGLVRAPAQTQHEFAAAAGSRLVSLTGEGRLATLAAMIADAFYCVRFGQRPLDNLQAQAVEQALVEIAAIGKNKGH